MLCRNSAAIYRVVPFLHCQDTPYLFFLFPFLLLPSSSLIVFSSASSTFISNSLLFSFISPPYSPPQYSHLYCVPLGLNNQEDWNVRITSLQGLQSLAVGDGGEFESFAGHLKANHELVQT